MFVTIETNKKYFLTKKITYTKIIMIFEVY